MPRVSIPDSSVAIDVNEGEILYDSLADRGVKLPHGCLSGSCGACRVQILEGKDNLAKPGVIEQDTINSLKTEFTQLHGADFVQDKEIRLACRAKVMGDVSLKTLK